MPRGPKGEKRPEILPAFPQARACDLHDKCTGFCTESSAGFPQFIHQLINRPIHSPKQRPVIPQDHAGGVVAGRAGDAAAGMRAGAAVVETLQGSAIIGVA